MSPSSKHQRVFGGRYEAVWLPREKTTEKGLCYVFAGQGGTFPRMFIDDFYRPELRTLFENADSLASDLGLPPPSRYILAPEELTDSEKQAVQNIALFVLEVGLARVLFNKGRLPQVMTSHSFGEYAMWCVAGAMTFEDMLRVVAYREKVSPPPNTRGYLIAVALSEKEVRNRLGQVIISNFNSPTQTVIAVAPGDKDLFLSTCQSKGIKAKLLPTPQPYHSPFLNDVEKQMQKFLTSQVWKCRPSQVGVISSVTGEYYPRGFYDGVALCSFLSKQVTRPVQFISQIEKALELGAKEFIEIGPKPLLVSLVQQNLKNQGKAYFLQQKLKRATREQDLSIKPSSRWFGMVTGVIAKITGYQIEEIRLEDRFQDDLGIDSLRKTEILVSVMNEAKASGLGVDIGRFRQVKDLVQFLEEGGGSEQSEVSHTPDFRRYRKVWVPKKVESKTLPVLRWLTIEPKGIEPSGETKLSIEDRLSVPKQGLELLVVEFSGWKSVIEKYSLSGGVGNFTRLLEKLAKALQRFDTFLPKSCLVILPKDLGLYAEALVGLTHSLRKELPGTFFKVVGVPSGSSFEELKRIVSHEVTDGFDTEVSYRNGERWVPRLSQVESSSKKKLEKNVILAIGGAKGITYKLLEYYSRSTPCKLYIVGRSPESEVSQELQNLRNFKIDVKYFSVDASQGDALREVFLEVKNQESKIDWVICGAGVERSRPLRFKEATEIQEELQSKILPAYFSLKYAEEFGAGKTACFSSVVALVGNEGQTVYAFSNRLINAMVSEARARGIQALSFNWPPWDGVGMTQQPVIRLLLQQKGISLLSEQQAADFFWSDMENSPETADGSVYYYDEYDRWAYEAPLWDSEVVQNVIGSRISESRLPAFDRLVSESTDPFLLDHQVGGQTLIPAAWGMVTFLFAGLLRYRSLPVLTDVRFKSPLVVEKEPRHLFLRLQEEKGLVKASWLSQLPAFEAVISAPSTSDWGVEVTDSKFSKSLFADDIYLPRGTLFHGAKFQVIDRIDFSEEEITSLLRPTDTTSVLKGGLWGSLLLWFDGVFQALGVSSDKPGLALPYSVGRVVLNPRLLETCPAQIRFHVKAIRSKGEDISADVTLAGLKGEILGTLEKVTLKRLSEMKSLPEAA